MIPFFFFVKKCTYSGEGVSQVKYLEYSQFQFTLYILRGVCIGYVKIKIPTFMEICLKFGSRVQEKTKIIAAWSFPVLPSKL